MPTPTHTSAKAAALERLARRSVAVIEAGQAASGAYVASPSFPVYRYAWFRDGAFIADAMSRAGRPGSADAFFAWCSEVLVARREKIAHLVARRLRAEPIEPRELLHCRYTLDGDEAPEEWWNFQPDGYGTWLWALDQHLGRHGGPLAPHRDAVELCVRYLAAFWDEPSYDWWEENIGQVHTSTLGALYGGLTAAAGFDGLTRGVREQARRTADAIQAAVREHGISGGHLTKWLGGAALDASLLACATPFRLLSVDDPVMAQTVRRLEAELAHGGVHRYAADTYYGGGEWILLAALLGWHYAEAGRTDDAWAQLDWVAAQATPTGELPEQADAHLLFPERRAEWIARWGRVATPLLWSHAMFLTLALELDAVQAPLAAAA